jgi:ABC-2 type transport system ATP-binding protein
MFHPELTKKIGELSRGNKQKIALIGAFMTNPELVILDEPSSGLDPLMQSTFIELIRQEQVRGTTIFMSSHYLNEVVDVCTRILLIKAGKLVKDMPAQDLLGSGGKVVRLVSSQKVDPLRRASMIQRSKDDTGHVLTFVFSGKPALLQQWLSSVTGLVDISITDHDVEAAFEDIYEQEAE